MILILIRRIPQINQFDIRALWYLQLMITHQILCPLQQYVLRFQIRVHQILLDVQVVNRSQYLPCHLLHMTQIKAAIIVHFDEIEE